MTIDRLISKQDSICIIGLGYVGLPLLMAFRHHVNVIGFDNDEARIEQLLDGKDRNGDYLSDDFKDGSFTLSSEESDIADCTVYVVAVPTPITKYKTPDLSALKSASESVGRNLSQGDVVIFESTVYPGCTEEICIPILEKVSGLKNGIGFFTGYSPERINPGDVKHTIKNTIKIVSGTDEKTLEFVASLYELIIEAGVHRAETIKVAEAAKIVENVQRDVNIALVNELSLIFDRLDIDTFDVIKAAATKWNFQTYYPGLVGGHCISVDPYYLTYKAEEVGYYPEVILSGRKVNDSITKNVAKKVLQMIGSQAVRLSQSRVLIMGVTFKENVPDTRNSKVLDLIHYLKSYHIDVEVLDPYADKTELPENYDINLVDEPTGKYHCLVVAVKHKEFAEMSIDDLLALSLEDGGIIDIKGIFRSQSDQLKRNYWTL